MYRLFLIYQWKVKKKEKCFTFLLSFWLCNIRSMVVWKLLVQRSPSSTCTYLTELGYKSVKSLLFHRRAGQNGTKAFWLGSEYGIYFCKPCRLFSFEGIHFDKQALENAKWRTQLENFYNAIVACRRVLQ